MSSRTRVNLYLAITFLVVFCTTSAVLYRSLMDSALDEVRRESMLRMQMALAVRKYTIDEIRPLLQASGHTYQPQAIPAYAAIRSMALLQQEDPHYRYQEVALNPTNPANKAGGWQVEAIETFRADPSRTELTRFTDTPAGQVMHVLRPVRPTADCMACHGPAAQAPGEMLKRYGASGLGWKVGDTVGAQIVSVPTSHAIGQAREAWWWHVSATVVVFGTLFLVLNRMLSRGVIAPIETRSSAWRELASRDPLTGAFNRRSFEERGEALVQGLPCAGSGPGTAPLSLVAIDIDHFKAVNDEHGHARGDSVLKEFARRVQLQGRLFEGLYRLGGEEFALWLPSTTTSEAFEVAEALRRALEAEPFDGIGRLTASFGVAQRQPGESAQALMQRADEALYAAKRAGRNRVECAAEAAAAASAPPVGQKAQPAALSDSRN